MLSLCALCAPALAHGQQGVLTPRDSALVAQYLSVLEAKFLRRDPQPLALLADSAYVVVTPGGLLESREAALRGVQNFRIDSISLTTPRVQRGTIVVLTAELRLVGAIEARRPDGAVRRVSLTGPYRVLAIFVDDRGAQPRLIAESVTPCAHQTPELLTRGRGDAGPREARPDATPRHTVQAASADPDVSCQ